MNAILQNRYTLLRVLGQGGMGKVYLAQDNRLGGREVAIKELSITHIPPSEREAQLQAFRQEAMILGKLRHPGIASVSDFFFETGNAYLVMEYVPGQTLRHLLQQQPNHQLSTEQTVDFTNQLCQVLGYLHRQQPPLIFRDLKPENVMVQPDGQLKLIDFGIARLFKSAQQRDTVAMGTPGYASPEHYGQGQTDPRSDIYSLGIVLHEMLTGQAPSRRTPFTPLEWGNIAATSRLPTLKAVVLKATQVDPALRYESVMALHADLPVPITTMAATSRFPMWAVIGIVLLLLVLVGGGVMWAMGRSEPSSVVETSSEVDVSPVVVVQTVMVTKMVQTEIVAVATAVATAVPIPTVQATDTPEPTPTVEPTPTTAVTVFVLEVSGDQLKTETGLTVQEGQHILVEYMSGSWRAGPLPTWPLVGPEGDPQVASKSIFPVQNAAIMTLVVGVGEERPLPADTIQFELISSTSGELWLGPNDDNPADNAGSLTLRITVTD